MATRKGGLFLFPALRLPLALRLRPTIKADAMIELSNVSKTYGSGDSAVHALQNVNLTIPKGTIHGVIGLSDLAEQIEVLHIPSADLEDVGVLVDDFHVARVDDLRDRGHVERITGFA